MENQTDFNNTEELGEWLEDSNHGVFKRFATSSEESTWVCSICGTKDADPYEDGCAHCGAEPDMH